MSKPVIEHISPDGLNKNPAFTNVITVTGPVKTVYIGGQDAIDGNGNIVGVGDLKAQSEQVMTNIQIALKAAGAEMQHVIKWTVYIVEGQPLREGFAAFQAAWGNRPNPPTVSMMFVAALANPDFLVEIDAIAVVPQ